MEQGFPLALVVGFPLLVGTLSLRWGGDLEVRLGVTRGRALAAYLILGAHAMASLFAGQAAFFVWTADALVLRQNLSSTLFLSMDRTAAPFVVLTMALGMLEHGARAIRPDAQPPRQGALGSLLISATSLLMLAGSSDLTVMVWAAVAALLMFRRPSTRGVRGHEIQLLLEGVGFVVLLGLVVVVQAEVGSASWDALAGAAYSVLRVRASDSMGAGMSISDGILVVAILAQLLRAVGLGCGSRAHASWGVIGAVTLGSTYLITRWAWVVDLSLEGTLVAVAVAVACTVVTPMLPMGRLARAIGRVGSVGFMAVEVLCALLRSLEMLVVDWIPEMLSLLFDDMRIMASVGTRRLGVAAGTTRRMIFSIICGVCVVLASLYLRPSVATMLPGRIYPFGGLRPEIHTARRPQTQPEMQPESAAGTRPDVERPRRIAQEAAP